MMLVQLPAIDAVAVPLPRLGLSLNFGHLAVLARPGAWLALLASLVILSSIRAALLYIRPPPSTDRKADVTLVAVPQAPSDEKKQAAPPPTSPQTTQRTTWLWGLVAWDALPALPVVRVQGRRWGSRQQQGQGQGQQHGQQQGQQHSQPGRRSPGPAFDHPPPAFYQQGPPVSMAKMIMSRHTFRRPSARPPPARSANTVQYQRRVPSMV